MSAQEIHKYAFRYIVAVILLFSYMSSGNVSIIASHSIFDSVNSAAFSENKVNWWDSNSSDDSACIECFAAVELANYLPKCFKLDHTSIDFNSPERILPDNDLFILGTRRSNKYIESIISELPDLKTDQSFSIQTLLQKKRTVIVIEGKTSIGVLYGVYEYLERQGVKFYGLGDKGVLFTSLKKDSFAEEMSIAENPAFITRGFHTDTYRFGSSELFVWMARNRMNMWNAMDPQTNLLKKLGIKLAGGGHTLFPVCLDPNGKYPYNHTNFIGDEQFPADPYDVSNEYHGDSNNDREISYFEAHPEWYCLVDGKRRNNVYSEGTGENYCTSNPDAAKEFAKNVVFNLSSGIYKYVDILNLWPLDNGKWCQCDSCQKQGSYTDRIFKVADTVLREIKTAREEGRLHRRVDLWMCAYHETLPPPKLKLPDDFSSENFAVTFFPIERCYVHSFADPACTEINRFLLNDFYSWVNPASSTYNNGNLCIGEYYNVSSFMSMPLVFTRIMATDIPWYYKHGIKHFFYMHCPTAPWGTWTLNQSLVARLLWNPNLNVEMYLNAFFASYYPTTADYARKFYENLEMASANMKAFKHYVGIGDGRCYCMRKKWINDSNEIFPLTHLKYETTHSLTDDGPDVIEIMNYMNKAGVELDAAMLECSDKTEQARLLEDNMRYQFGLAVCNFYYHMIRTSLFHRKGNAVFAKMEFQKAACCKKTLMEFDNLALPNLDGSDRNGFDATQAVEEYKYFENIYSE